MTTNDNRTPLESLVIYQLADLFHREQDLQIRYARLGTEDLSQCGVAEFSEELSCLQERADRLRRLLESMGAYYSEREFKNYRPHTVPAMLSFDA